MMADIDRKPTRNSRKCAEISRILLREEIRAQSKKVTQILKKEVGDRTTEESEILEQSTDIARGIQKRAKARDLMKQRQLEVEDSDEELREKCCQLAAAIRESQSLVLYTGAGISTAASIPDYRGPKGVWTLLQQGIQPEAQDLSSAEPTFTHMCISKLYRENLVKYVVSQNCDGLHLRSGLPRSNLSEVHGNMYIEVCDYCNPTSEYVRLFDVTEKTGVRKHKTGRFCHHCGRELRDTIVHFGEKGDYGVPHRWQEAAKATDVADTIVCLGSSLKILKKYACLWGNHKSQAQRPKLYIVNLQWTPKDFQATLKINGRCDAVMRHVMEALGLQVPQYTKLLDPIFLLSCALAEDEVRATTKGILTQPQGYREEEIKAMLEMQAIHPLDSSNQKIGKKKKQKKSQKIIGVKVNPSEQCVARNTMKTTEVTTEAKLAMEGHGALPEDAYGTCKTKGRLIRGITEKTKPNRKQTRGGHLDESRKKEELEHGGEGSCYGDQMISRLRFQEDDVHSILLSDLANTALASELEPQNHTSSVDESRSKKSTPPRQNNFGDKRKSLKRGVKYKSELYEWGPPNDKPLPGVAVDQPGVMHPDNSYLYSPAAEEVLMPGSQCVTQGNNLLSPSQMALSSLANSSSGSAPLATVNTDVANLLAVPHSSGMILSKSSTVCVVHRDGQHVAVNTGGSFAIDYSKEGQAMGQTSFYMLPQLSSNSVALQQTPGGLSPQPLGSDGSVISPRTAFQQDLPGSGYPDAQREMEYNSATGTFLSHPVEGLDQNMHALQENDHPLVMDSQAVPVQQHFPINVRSELATTSDSQLLMQHNAASDGHIMKDHVYGAGTMDPSSFQSLQAPEMIQTDQEAADNFRTDSCSSMAYSTEGVHDAAKSRSSKTPGENFPSILRALQGKYETVPAQDEQVDAQPLAGTSLPGSGTAAQPGMSPREHSYSLKTPGEKTVRQLLALREQTQSQTLHLDQPTIMGEAHVQDQAQAETVAQTQNLPHSQDLTPNHMQAFALAHSLAHTQAQTLGQTQAHPLVQTLAHTQDHTQTQVQTFAQSQIKTLSQLQTQALSQTQALAKTPQVQNQAEEQVHGQVLSVTRVQHPAIAHRLSPAKSQTLAREPMQCIAHVQDVAQSQAAAQGQNLIHTHMQDQPASASNNIHTLLQNQALTLLDLSLVPPDAFTQAHALTEAQAHILAQTPGQALSLLPAQSQTLANDQAQAQANALQHTIQQSVNAQAERMTVAITETQGAIGSLESQYFQTLTSPVVHTGTNNAPCSIAYAQLTNTSGQDSQVESSATDLILVDLQGYGTLPSVQDQGLQHQLQDVRDSSKDQTIKMAQDNLSLPYPEELHQLAAQNTGRHVATLSCVQPEAGQMQCPTKDLGNETNTEQPSKQGLCLVDVPGDNTVGSAPGWFGKGLSIRKLKRKRTK